TLVKISSGLWINENLHFNNAVVGANVQNLTTELVGQAGDGIQVLVLVSQSLTGRKMTGVVFLVLIHFRNRLLLLVAFQGLPRSGNLTVVLQKLLEELRAQNANLSQQEFALHQ